MPADHKLAALKPVPIHSLPPDTRSLLGSTLLLPDVPSILVALVNNALASQPRKIRIELQLTQDAESSAWPSVTCTDDGSGFAQAWCEDSRKLDHGTLASMARVGKLELLTLPHIGGKSDTWWSVVGERGSVSYSGPSDKAKLNSNRQDTLALSPFSRGSSVRVSNIFASVPVRRKLLISNANEAQVACIRAMQTVALRAPRVSFELVAHSGSKTAALLKLRAVERQVTRCADVLGTSIDDHQEIDAATSLKAPGHAVEKHEILLQSSTEGCLHVRGLLILSPVARTGRTIFWGNGQLAEESDEGEALHSALYKLLAKTPYSSDAAPTSASHRLGYVLELDVCTELGDTGTQEGESAVRRALLQSVISSLEHIVGDVLRKRGLLPPLPTSRKRTLPELPAEPTVDKEQSPTSTPAVQRFKKYKKRSHSSFGDRIHSFDQSASQPRSKSGTSTKAVLRDRGQAHVGVANSSSAHMKPPPDASSNMIDLVGRSYTVDPRTGSSFRSGLPNFRLPSTLVPGSGGPAQATPSWLRDALKDWSDPVLPAPAERPVAQVSHASAQGVEASADGLLEGAALDKARVLGQVENKFVACAIPCTHGSCLALVDQHAADERVRFEAFLHPFLQAALSSSTGPDSFAIPKPLLFKLHSPQARTLLEPHAHEALARWGFRLSPHQACDEAEYNVSVQAVPSLLRERLTTGPVSLENVLLDLASWLEEGGAKKLEAARAVLERRQSATHAGASGIEAQAQHEWMNALRHLPASLLRLIASKACRGAVMFGDPLEHQQCQRLVAELSLTALPLQCAHGRPTIVPLCKPDEPSPRRKVNWGQLSNL